MCIRDSAEELVERATEQTSTKIPKFAVSGMLQIVRRTIRSRAKIDINDISAIDHTPKLYVPALFCVVKGDSFIAVSYTHLTLPTKITWSTRWS